MAVPEGVSNPPVPFKYMQKSHQRQPLNNHTGLYKKP